MGTGTGLVHAAEIGLGSDLGSGVVASLSATRGGSVAPVVVSRGLWNAGHYLLGKLWSAGHCGLLRRPRSTGHFHLPRKL